MKDLPRPTKEVVQLAACLGPTVSSHCLKILWMAFDSAEARAACFAKIKEMEGRNIRAVRKVSDDAFWRLTGKGY